MEQAIVSAWSARYYNPGCYIVMVCCQDTFATLEHGYRKEYKSLFDEIIVREFQSEQGMIERSRWMKTSLRNIVDGDLLYIDTDTVVCGDLSFLDNYNYDIGMVLDCNCEFSNCLVYDNVVTQMKKIYKVDVRNETFYFNSGVIFVRDCQSTRDFYRRWNELWVYSLKKFNIMKDQQPLMKANIDMGYAIAELSGNMNCQVAESIQYLYSAFIVHFLNNLNGKFDMVSPFYGEIFKKVKQSGIDNDLKEKIINCKMSFSSPSMLVSRDVALLWREYLSIGGFPRQLLSTKTFCTLNYTFQHFPRLMWCMEKICAVLISLSRIRKKH